MKRLYRLFLLIALVTVTLGCQKESEPSQEFALAEAFGQATFGGRAPGAAVTARMTVSPTAQLIQATGTVDTIYVVVERGREQYLARGGVYSHYEFLWPLDDPMTDATWREMLAAGAAPPRPEWVQALMPE